MASYFWKSFIVICGTCGHRNRPDPSPRVGIRMALTGQLGNCRGCQKVLRPPVLRDRPLTRQIRAELISKGITPVC